MTSNCDDMIERENINKYSKEIICAIFCSYSICNFRSSPELLTLTAVKHLIEGSVTTEEAVQDLAVTLL